MAKTDNLVIYCNILKFRCIYSVWFRWLSLTEGMSYSQKNYLYCTVLFISVAQTVQASATPKFKSLKM